MYTSNVTNECSVTGTLVTLLMSVVLLYTSNVTNERSVTGTQPTLLMSVVLLVH